MKNILKFLYTVGMGLMTFGLFFFSISVASADTLVSSDITRDTRWTTGGSPYVVYVDQGQAIHVARNATLKIEPGVTVKFNVGTGLDVAGKLIAHGNKDQMITFTSIYDNGRADLDTPHEGDWYGMAVRGDDSVLKHVRINYAGRAGFMGYPRSFSLYINGDRSHFTNSVVENGAGNGVWLDYYYDGLFHNNLIQNHHQNGVVLTHSQTDLFRNVIRKNGQSGIAVFTRSSSDFASGRLVFHGNFIEQNRAHGIYLDTLQGPDIHDNEIHHNALSGIDIMRGYPRVHHNAIHANKNGISVAMNWPLFITNNDFKDNDHYGIRVDKISNKYSGVQAQNNWWGNVGGPNNDTSYTDRASHGVDYRPWFTTHNSKFFTVKKFNTDRPDVAQHLRGYSDGQKVRLNWRDSLDDDFLVYRIYKSQNHKGPYEQIATTTQPHFIDYAFELGKTYYYRITAVDFSGNESEMSPWVKVKYQD